MHITTHRGANPVPAASCRTHRDEGGPHNAMTGPVLTLLLLAAPRPDARGRAARAEAGAARLAVVGRHQKLLLQIRKALAEHALAEQEPLIHLDHMELTSRFLELARSTYQAGLLSSTLMAGVTLPWLWGRSGSDEREAERLLAADRAALESARRLARFQVRDAKTRLDAARDSYDILDGQVVPQWRQAAQAAFAAGGADALSVLDANRSYLQVRLGRGRALARLHAALADLQRAAGHLHGFSAAPEGAGE